MKPINKVFKVAILLKHQHTEMDNCCVETYLCRDPWVPRESTKQGRQNIFFSLCFCAPFRSTVCLCVCACMSSNNLCKHRTYRSPKRWHPPTSLHTSTHTLVFLAIANLQSVRQTFFQVLHRLFCALVQTWLTPEYKATSAAHSYNFALSQTPGPSEQEGGARRLDKWNFPSFYMQFEYDTVTVTVQLEWKWPFLFYWPMGQLGMLKSFQRMSPPTLFRYVGNTLVKEVKHL